MHTRCLLLVTFVSLAGCSSDSSGSDTGNDRTDSSTLDANRDSTVVSDSNKSTDRSSTNDQTVNDQAADVNADRSVSDQAQTDVVVEDTSVDSGDLCQQLIADFKTLLAEVKQCNPYTAMNECTLKIPNSLDCPCDTYVNSGKASKIFQMENLDKQYKSNNCVPQGCPPMPCPEPTSGSCEEQPGEIGLCRDDVP